MNILKPIFNKKKEEALGYGNPAPIYNWGIIIPHTKKSRGAKSKEKEMSEYGYGLEFAGRFGIPSETRDDGGVPLAAKRLKLKGCNASLEPHKNAFNNKAFGFSILVLHDDSESIRFAEIIAQNFKDAFPDRRLRNKNGVKKLFKGDRGYHNLLDAKKAGMEIALLSEEFFIDNPIEWMEPSVLADFWKDNLIQG
jgi:hypothetical protein